MQKVQDDGMLKQHVQVGLTDEVRLKFSFEEDETINQPTGGKNFHQRIQQRSLGLMCLEYLRNHKENSVTAGKRKRKVRYDNKDLKK